MIDLDDVTYIEFKDVNQVLDAITNIDGKIIVLCDNAHVAVTRTAKAYKHLIKNIEHKKYETLKPVSRHLIDLKIEEMRKRIFVEYTGYDELLYRKRGNVLFVSKD